MIEIIKHHKIRTCCFGIAALFIGILLILKYKFKIELFHIITPIQQEQQEIFFLNISINNWLTIIYILGSIFGIPWAIHRYDCTKREKQQEKAAKIANQFAEETMEKLSIINSIFTGNEKFKKLLEKVDQTKLKVFSMYEMIDITGDKKIIENFILLFISDELQNSYKKFLDNNYTTEEKQQFNYNFTSLVENTLNKLEAICIDISSQAAGSQYIYQSLHQEFLKSIHILSILISSYNTNNFDKYYTNIIAVYNLWQNQKQKDRKKFDKTIQKIEKLKSKSKKEIKKLEQKRKTEVKKLLSKKPDRL